MNKWLNKDEWDLEKAWRNWRTNTIGIPQELAKEHESYKAVQDILNKSKNDIR